MVPQVCSEQSTNTSHQKMKAVHNVLLFAALTGGATCLFNRSYTIVKQSLTWTDAQTYCRKNFVDLSTFQAEMNISACQSHHCWIGLSKKPQETAFTRWSDGSKLEFTAWQNGEPSGLSSNHCVTVVHSYWANYNCTIPLNFICYKWVPRLIVVEQMLSWEDALKYCRKYYTDIISLTTKLDLFAVNRMTIATPNVWTGLRFMDGQWFWVNKNPLWNLTSLPSCPIRPYLCGALKSGGDTLENRDCNEKMKFICYRK